MVPHLRPHGGRRGGPAARLGVTRYRRMVTAHRSAGGNGGRHDGLPGAHRSSTRIVHSASTPSQLDLLVGARGLRRQSPPDAAVALGGAHVVAVTRPRGCLKVGYLELRARSRRRSRRRWSSPSVLRQPKVSSGCPGGAAHSEMVQESPGLEAGAADDDLLARGQILGGVDGDGRGAGGARRPERSRAGPAPVRSRRRSDTRSVHGSPHSRRRCRAWCRAGSARRARRLDATVAVGEQAEVQEAARVSVGVSAA